MTYEYKCNNDKCPEYQKVYEIQMSMSEYSEDKLPKCQCGEQTVRSFSGFGLRTFGDGYKA